MRRRLIVSIILLTTAVAANGADPIVGTWKLNIAKSNFSPVLQAVTKRAAPKEHTEIYREIDGDLIEFTTTEIRADGSSDSGRLTWPRQGGMVKVLEGQSGLLLIESFIGPGNWYVTGLLKDGRQFGVRHKTVSKDGKTLRQTITGMDQGGKAFEQLEVYERQ